MKSLLDPGIRNSYVQGCPIELFSAMAAGLGGIALPVAGQTFGAAVSTADVGSIFYAGSRRSFNTDYAQWTTPRVIQARLLQLDAGTAAFRIESDTHHLEAWFDINTSAWTGLVDGVEGAMLATGDFDDVVTFRISGDVAEVKVNDTVVATSAGLFQGESVRLLMSWDTTGAVDGDAIAGQVLGGVFGDAIGYAEEGDGDWCGKALNIVTLQDTAPGAFSALASVTYMERHTQVMIHESLGNEDVAPGTFAASASTTLLERREVVSINTDNFDAPVEETAPGAFSAAATVTFMERRQVISE